MYIAVLKINQAQANNLSLIGLSGRLLTPENDLGGKYHGWHQFACSKEEMDRLRVWVTHNMPEHKFF
jgi:hypothetical protein